MRGGSGSCLVWGILQEFWLWLGILTGCPVACSEMRHVALLCVEQELAWSVYFLGLRWSGLALEQLRQAVGGTCMVPTPANDV